MFLAAERCSPAVVQYLVTECGLDPEKGKSFGNRPTHAAASQGNVGALSALIRDLGCDVNAVDDDSWTPLHYACLNDQPEAVAWQVVNGKAHIHAKNEERV